MQSYIITASDDMCCQSHGILQLLFVRVEGMTLRQTPHSITCAWCCMKTLGTSIHLHHTCCSQNSEFVGGCSLLSQQKCSGIYLVNASSSVVIAFHLRSWYNCFKGVLGSAFKMVPFSMNVVVHSN